MSCLKLQPGTLKQCLLDAEHTDDCVFTLLKPEVAATQDKRKERDNQLVRRNLADGYLKATLSNPSPDTIEVLQDVTDEVLVQRALDLADALIAKTGGFGP